MKITWEIKVSDGNYGNTTHNFSFTIDPFHFTKVLKLLQEYELLYRRLRMSFENFDEEEASVKDAREYHNLTSRCDSVADELKQYMQEPHNG